MRDSRWMRHVSLPCRILCAVVGATAASSWTAVRWKCEFYANTRYARLNSFACKPFLMQRFLQRSAQAGTFCQNVYFLHSGLWPLGWHDKQGLLPITSARGPEAHCEHVSKCDRPRGFRPQSPVAMLWMIGSSQGHSTVFAATASGCRSPGLPIRQLGRNRSIGGKSPPPEPLASPPRAEIAGICTNFLAEGTKKRHEGT